MDRALPTETLLVPALRDELAAARLLARSFCHDASNFLAVVTMCADVGLGSDSLETAKRALGRIRDAAPRLTERSQAYARWASGEGVAPLGRGVDLASAAELAADLAGHALDRAQIVLERALEPAPAAVEPHRALALVVVLLAGAALRPRPRSRGRARLRTARARGGVPVIALEVSDAGEVALDGALERSLADAAESAEPKAPALSGARAIASLAGGELRLGPIAGGYAVRVALRAL